MHFRLCLSQYKGPFSVVIRRDCYAVDYTDLLYAESPPPPYVSPAPSEKQLAECFSSGEQCPVLDICHFSVSFLLFLY